jgi:hypothetical protein
VFPNYPASNSNSSQRLSSATKSLHCTLSQSHIATDGHSASLGVEPRLRLMTGYLLLSDSYGLVFMGRPLLRGDGSVFCYVLLALASVVFLGSESLGTGDHLLLSQIWDFPVPIDYSSYKFKARIAQKKRFSYSCIQCCVHSHRRRLLRKRRFPASPLAYVRNLLLSNGRCLHSHYLAIGLYAKILFMKVKLSLCLTN